MATAFSVGAHAGEGAGSDPTTLYRRAQLADEAGRYGEAFTAYGDFLEVYPNHRLARAARARRAFLETAMGPDAEPFARFERVRRGYAELGRDAAIEQVQTILDEFPDFALAPDAWLWLADRYVEAGEDDRALEAYATLIEKFPDSRNLFYAHAGRGAIALQRGDYDEAEQEYLAAASTNHLGAEEIASNEIQIVRAHARRYRVYRVVVPLLVLILAAFLLTIRFRDLKREHLRTLWLELALLGPLVIVLWLLSGEETRWSIATLTLACTAVLAIVTLWAETARPRRWKPWAGVGGAAVAIAATVYVVLYHYDQLVALGM